MKKVIFILFLASSLVSCKNSKTKELSENEKKIKETTDLVDIKEINPKIIVNLRFSGTKNVAGMKIYPFSKCYLRKNTAEKLNNVQKELEKMELNLMVSDAYRPLSIQKKMWELSPDDRLFANRENGVLHATGAAVDVTLLTKDGTEINMGSIFDEFSPRAEIGNSDIPQNAQIFRVILSQTMAKCGFVGNDNQWWHFNDSEISKYDKLDLPL